jgi:Tol biopolymer transport system component/tetratricopeptide (TPR) repeat protein
MIRRSGDQVRVTVQMVSTATGAQIWGGQLDETFTSLMRLEDGLAKLVAEALIPRLNEEERALLQKRDTDNPQAYEAYLRGRYYWTAYTVDSMAKALVCFLDAIDKDPGYARAHAGVADYYNLAGVWSILPAEESFAAAKRAALSALALNPNLPETQTAYGYAVWNHEWDSQTAERCLRRAIELNESYPPVHTCLAFLLSAKGKHAEAIAEADRALELDPLTPGIASSRSLILLFAGEVDRALEAAQAAIQPTSENATVLLSYSLAANAKQDHKEAIAKARRAVAVSDTSRARATLAAALALAGEETEARQHLKSLCETARDLPVSHYDLALIYIALQENERALASLEKCAANREWWIRFLPVDRRFARLQRMPRYTALTKLLAEQPSSPSNAPAAVTPRHGSSRTWIKWVWIAAAVAAVGLVMAVVLPHLTIEDASYFRTPQFTKITTSGNATVAAISPDGRYVAYALNEAGKFSLWVRQVSFANGVRIVPASRSIFRGLTFSRDGAYIYYVLYDNNRITRGTLYRVPALGGMPQKVADQVSGAVSLSPDNLRQAFIRSDYKTGVDELIIANLDGGGQARLASRTYPQHFAYSSAPAWSPDGQVMAVASENTDARGFYINLVGIRLKDHSERILCPRRWQYIEQVAWLPDRRGILVVGKDQEASFQQIWYVPLSSGEPRRLTNDLNDYYGISVTMDAHTLVSAQAQTLTNVWKQSGNSARRITPGYGRFFDLSIAPNGNIVYASDASGNADIWLMDGEGGANRQLTSRAHRNYSPSVSPDGRLIAFHSNRSGTWNIWTMDTEGGNLKQLTNEANDSNWPVWTPDGQSIVYHHIASKGYQTIWKIPAAGGTPVQLTDHFSMRPDVSPKDGSIACWYAEEAGNPKWELAVLPPDGGAPLKRFAIPATTSVDSTLRWTADGKGISYADVQGGVSNIWIQSVEGGPPRQITNFNSDRIFSLDWSDRGDLTYSRGLRTYDIVLITDSK